MKRNFKKSGWFLSVLILVSCQTYHPLHKENYFNGSVLYNDPLDIKLEYFGDIEFRSLSEISKKKLRRMIGEVDGLETKDLLAYGSTTMNPEYELFLFIKPNATSREKTPVRLILRDSLHKKVVYSKAEGDKMAYLLLKATGSNKSIQSINRDAASLMENFSFESELQEELDYSKVFEAIRDDPNYLLAREKLKEAPILVTDQSEWMQFQFLATINSFMGNNSEYLELIGDFEENRREYLEPVLDTLFKDPAVFTNASVVREIAALANKTRVVMLNENH